MIVASIDGYTRKLGESQGYQGLPVRDGLIECEVAGGQVPVMTTAWTPTTEELAALNAGASVNVHLQGTGHPPIMVNVGEVPR